MTFYTRRDALRAAAGGMIAGTILSTVPPGGATQGDVHTGEVIWESDVNVGDSPGVAAVVEDVVYVGSGESALAIDARTGELDWESSSFAGTGSLSPNVVGDAVYITGGRSVWEYSTAGLSDSNLGEQWKRDIEVDNNGSPTATEGMVYFCDQDGNVYAVDTETQEFAWTFEANPYGKTLSPAVADGSVYTGGGGFGGEDGGAVYALDAETGEEQWSVAFDQEQEPSGVTVADGVVYAIAGDSGNQVFSVFALDASTGAVNWSNESELDNTAAGDITPLTVADGTIYYGLGEVVQAIDAGSGAEEWTHEIADVSNTLMPPTVADGTVFTGGEGRNVVALDAATGKEIWSTDNLGGLERSFGGIVVAGALFLTSDEASVYALNAGVEGSSVDSRIQNGVDGHHHDWAGTDPPDEPYAVPSEPPSDGDGDDSGGGNDDGSAGSDGDDGNGSEGNGSDGDDGGGEDGGDGSDGADGDGPGFGVLGALAGISAGVYATLRRRDGSAEQRE